MIGIGFCWPSKEQGLQSDLTAYEFLNSLQLEAASTNTLFPFSHVLYEDAGKPVTYREYLDIQIAGMKELIANHPELQRERPAPPEPQDDGKGFGRRQKSKLTMGGNR